jgi:hypothetical protein
MTVWRCGKGRESVGGEIWNVTNCFIVLCKCNARNVNYIVISSVFYYYPVVHPAHWLLILGSHSFVMQICRIMFLININIIWEIFIMLTKKTRRKVKILVLRNQIMSFVEVSVCKNWVLIYYCACSWLQKTPHLTPSVWKFAVSALLHVRL